MTRDEHLTWCKTRALEYLDRGDRSNAVASMISDMGKHPETDISGTVLAELGLFELMYGDTESTRRYIEGFN